MYNGGVGFRRLPSEVKRLPFNPNLLPPQHTILSPQELHVALAQLAREESSATAKYGSQALYSGTVTDLDVRMQL